MPYTHREVDDKDCVYKKGTKEKVGCTTGDINDYLGALHANVKTEEEIEEGIIDIGREKVEKLVSKFVTSVKEMLGEGKKVDKFVANVKKSEKKAGKGEKKATDIAWATANKKGMLDNKNKKTNEAAKPDANKNGTPDYAEDGKGKNDLKKTTGKKSMSAKQQKFFGKKKAVKESSELMHQAYQKFISEGIATYIAEDEEGKAKSITAAADMVNDFTSWMQRVGNYQTKSMIELADNIRANFGMQEAETFKAAVGTALNGALEALTSAREEINNAVAVLAGEAPAGDQMGIDAGMDMTPDAEAPDEFGGFDEAPTDDMNVAPDEFAASDAAAGGPETTGRLKRESIERGNRLMKILGS